MRMRDAESQGKRIRAGTKADVSTVVATVTGDWTNDAPAQRAASAAAATAAAAAAAVADAAGMLMLCLVLHRRLFRAEPNNLRHRMRRHPSLTVPTVASNVARIYY